MMAMMLSDDREELYFCEGKKYSSATPPHIWNKSIKIIAAIKAKQVQETR